MLDLAREQIHSVGSYIDGLSPDEDEAGFQDELVILDEVVGMTFTLCQTTVTAIASSVERFDSFALKRGVDVFPGVPGSAGRQRGPVAPRKRHELLALGPRTRGRKYPDVVYIDAFANYWKHCSEWPHQWHKPTVRKKMRGVQRFTTDICAAARLSSTRVIGNLRHACAFLGNPSPFTDIEVFARIVERWDGVIVGRIETELRRLKLI